VQIAADGSLIVSATDLVGYLACDHLATLELQALHGELEKPFRADPELDLIRRRGFEHEKAYLERLRADGRTVHEIATREARTPEELRAAEAETLEAMRNGADVIFQATFFDGRWRGHADFLLRVERPSDFGSWSYDIADTKLARRVRAAAIIQMCVYADLLERLQGVPPETLSVVTGDGIAHPHLLADYAAYYRAAKARFEASVFEGAERLPTYPDPVEHCRVCTWWPMCVDRRRADDHLSLVAGMSRSATKKLTLAGLPTLTALGRSPDDIHVKDLGQRSLERLRNQARLQAAFAESHELRYELIPPDDENRGRGLAALPEPSPHDLFFDIESDPWAIEGGLEYLFGMVEEVDGDAQYDALWAHDRESEKRVFESFIDRVGERLASDPAMHVYHYAAYEPTALRRLMGRHATREDELDRFLRAGVFVDLFQVVRQGLRASVESYSIKQVEKFYMPEREGPVTSAGFSVVEYERWMEARDQTVLDAIEAYNRDDCVSTWRLRSWLERLRVEAAPLYGGEPPARPTIQDGEPGEELAKAQAETREREEALRAGVPADRAKRTQAEQARWLLAGLLDWHRREAKPQWWDHYRLLRASDEDLIADSTALAGLTFEEDLGRVARSTLHRYRFDPSQETKLKEGDQPVDATSGEGAGTIVRLDPLAGILELKRNPSRAHPRALIPAMPYGTEPMRSALGRLADDVLANGIDEGGGGRYSAARDLILRRAPRIRGLDPGTALASLDESPTLAARRLGLELDRSVLPIQGPPGTGKTYTGARMILDLVATGKRVGVVAQAHRVIGNLLEAVAVAAAAEGVPVRIGQRCDEADEASTDERIERLDTNDLTRSGLASRAFDVVGGTSWLWAREDMESSVDVLFVDEAGQMSLATVCSVAGAAESIVLLGDPNQLPQVSQGSHPEGAAASALEHLVGEDSTIAPDRGLLLATTFRLHPDVNSYISDAFYGGRLDADPANARQVVADGPMLEGTGVRLLPVNHAGNGNRSREESATVVDAVLALLGRTWMDRRGRARPMTVDDVVVVAPYNAQVAEIGRALEASLGFRGRVGTVDKFQGQEAAVAIYSMATSTPEEAPRDLEFLYSANRLNVAMSRARSLAVLVCNPALLQVACRTPEQMRLLNKFWRLVEIATVQASEGAADVPTLPVGPMEPASDGPLVLWADLEPV
jgi:predicted RecB family nuclease